jgi:phosphatidylglycerol:prolipoprotein diacylglycerol transferase
MCPVLFRIGSFSLPTYGLLVAVAFLAGLYLAGRLARRAGLDSEALTNLGVYAALAAIVGAKLFMVALNWRYYADHPGQLFSLSALQAGGVFYGGLLAALAVAIWYSRRAGLPPLETADVLAPAAAIGHAIGRLGCFAAGCCWGKPTTVSWSVVFTDPVAHENVGVPLGIHLHATQLYESAGTLLIGLYLWRRFARPHAPGVILGLYLLCYSAFRFVVEFWRDPTGRNYPFDGPFTATQWVALGLLIAGALLLARKSRPVAAPAVKQA